MKGLLRKDIYMLAKYNRLFLLAVFVMAVAAAVTGSSFFTVYVGVLAGVLPITALAYDDREKWCTYCETMPVTRAQFVAEKYILALIVAAAVTALLGAGWLISGRSAALTPVLLPVILLAPSTVCLPLFFRLGAERGRAAYMIVIVLACVGAGVISQDGQGAQLSLGAGGTLALLGGMAAVFAASWALSTAAYKKREL